MHQNGEDEAAAVCAAWRCGRGMARCPGSLATCVRDQQLCDGAAQCPGAEDESEMEASDGLVVRCGGGAGQPCRLYTARHPGASYTDGVSCGDGECLRKVVL